MLKWMIALSVACLTLSACGRSDATPGTRAGHLTVDSILPLAEEVRRFTDAHGIEPTHMLKQRAASRDELVRRFVQALERSDTATLRTLSLGADEFIGLYYPRSAYARAPYRQSPAFVWFQFQQNSRKGLGRALARYGGQPSGFRGYRCASEPAGYGSLALWQDCVVDWSRHPASVRVFGTIIEHAGRFAFVSFANDL